MEKTKSGPERSGQVGPTKELKCWLRSLECWGDATAARAQNDNYHAHQGAAIVRLVAATFP
jgi:hypothetical protein